MKQLIFLSIILALGCNAFKDDSTKLGKQVIKDGCTIEVLLNPGGATVSDVVWIKKISKENENYIGKIKWHAMGGDSISISQISDSTIKITFTDTSTFKGSSRDFVLNLNRIIHANDGSNYTE